MHTSFCIVCHDRLEHLRQTLAANIDGNPGQNVEFVLLDYNSNDGLEKWVKDNMAHHIEPKTLVFYKDLTAPYFHRSHSRNMALRLASGRIICNLDADNFLSDGFAEYVLGLFKNDNDIFITSSYATRDAMGRVCMKKRDFMDIHGYDESIEGYGFEDVELYNRLQRSGLRQIYSERGEFYKSIRHSNHLRLQCEKLSQNKYELYIHYVNPAQSDFIVLYENHECLMGQLTDNFHKIFDIYDYELMDRNLRAVSEYRMVVLSSPMMEGTWQRLDNGARIDISGSHMPYTLGKDGHLNGSSDECYHRIIAKEICDLFMMNLSSAINYSKVKERIRSGNPVNGRGFGCGTVYKNFDYNTPITLN